MNAKPLHIRPRSEEPAGFADQLRSFLRRHLNWLLVGALALLLLQDVFGTHGLIAMRRSQQEAARVQREINQLNEQNRQMQERVKALKSDPQAIERIAREEMGLARPGEYIFKIQPKPGDAAPPNPPSGGTPEKP